jgi:hypothetical protein
MGERGQKLQFLPSGEEELVFNPTGQTVAIAATLARPTTLKVPRNATHFIIVASVNANTATTGHVGLRLYRDKSATLLSDSAMRVDADMISANAIASQQGIVPIVNGGIYYQTTIVGTVNYDLAVRIVGFVLE